MMKILHICAGWQTWNGAANIARLLMDEQRRDRHEVLFAAWASIRNLRSADEVWIHCSWKPCLWWAALWGKNVHWMPEASYDPIRRAYHGWKKILVGLIERFCLRRSTVIIATCEAEREWIRQYLGKRCPPIEVTDIKRFFNLNPDAASERIAGLALEGQKDNHSRPLHLLYLGRRHPLKGLEYLESALSSLQEQNVSFESRVISNAFGAELEHVWDWCDVLVLPTLTDNFGLVVAEALERGKRVITTDGAPAWGDSNDYGGRLTYLRGFRDGTGEARIRLIEKALLSIKRVQTSSSK